MFQNLGPFLPNVEVVGTLSRFEENSSKFPLSNTSFASGLSIYYKSLCSIGQINIARTFLGLCFKIEKLRKWMVRRGTLSPDGSCDDDFVRKSFKKVSSWAFPRTFSLGPAYSLFMHLENLGGPSPWTKQQILDDINAWTSGEAEGNLDLLRPYYDQAISEWGKPLANKKHLTFKEFCNDLLRWGTSGGAKSADLLGEKFRSKWAWGFRRILTDDLSGLREGADLYESALEEGNVCKVALKEETKKTREIITTPMASYLRQCYLVYRWGRLKGDTPISSAAWLGRFQGLDFKWYGCADAERFDHSVSKDIVKYIISKMSDVDEETRLVGKEEIDSLDNLTIEWQDKIWEYKGGLLSGWRLTSVIGTLTSLAIGKYIAHRSGLSGATIASMGDDIMLASPYHSIPQHELYKYYAETGFKVNLQKTISGPVGEFLRQTYSEKGVCGYAALAVPAIVYANPWLTRFELEKEQEISSGWLTLYSRLLPHSLDNPALTAFIRHRIKLDVRQHSRIKGNLDHWMDTPISAGGGGVVEWSNVHNWCTISFEQQFTSRASALLSMFNIIPKDQRVEKATSKFIEYINTPSVAIYVDEISRLSLEKEDIIPDYVNKTSAILSWYFSDGKYDISGLERRLFVRIPRNLRVGERDRVLRYLLGVTSSAAGICSVQTTKSSASVLSRFFNSLARVFSSNRKASKIGNLGAVSTMYALRRFKAVNFVSGTW
nr:MAG: RNA-dependent RNA polymerase [Picornaviridae sp.]